jgi:hypothetical protein
MEWNGMNGMEWNEWNGMEWIIICYDEYNSSYIDERFDK